jgi:hypothetical protein
MADQDFRDLAWMVRTHIPGIPDVMMTYHYVEAVRKHLKESFAWQHTVPNPVDLDAATAWPTLVEGTDYPTGTYIVQPVLLKWNDGQILKFKTRDQLDKFINAKWEQDTSGSKPRYWTALAAGNWAVTPQLAEDSVGKLYMRLAVAPKIYAGDVTGAIDEFIAYEYRDHWMHGALASLYAIPGKDWSDVRLAADYMALFESDIKSAKSRAAADYGRPERSVRYGGLDIVGTSGLRNANDYGRYYEL